MATTLISADFDVDEQGFVFRDDAFRDTSQPLYADGQRIPGGGFAGGALQVLLGGVDNADITGMSGGWDRDFTLATPQQVTLTFRVKLTQTSDYENDEFSQALVALDGTLLRSDGNDFVAQIRGNGNGGAARTTDWIEVEINLGILAAGNHTLTFGGFNNKKTLANEETEILFDDIEVVADDPPPGPGEGVLIDASFDAGTEGFVFLDDSFRGTSQPGFADGQFSATEGFTGGGLKVELGGIDNTDVNGMSGGWQTSFNLAEEAVVTISFRYNLTQAPNYEANEFSQVLLSLDGTLIGIDGNDFIDQINGNGNGGPPRTTGWQVVEINLGLLGPGNHSLILGGFNNRKTFADEETTLLLDDVLVTELPPPPPGDVVILQSDFESDTGGFGFIDDAFRDTSAPAYADGQRSTTEGFGGGGALTVELGGIDNADINGMSGGWRQTFNLGAETDAVLSFRYKLTQASNYENDEFSQVLVDLDGTLVTPNGNDFIDQITGNGNGGPERSTGWQVVEIDLGTLSAGSHTLTIGGFNNKKTLNDETTEILIDDLLLTAGGSAPILDLDLNDSSGPATPTGYADTFTEQGDGPPPVAAGVAAPIGDVDVDIDDPDGTQVQSATITLTNPQTGDTLSIFGGPGNLPTGIGIDVSSTATNLVLTGLASLADYESAIELVRFATGADDNPDTTQRIINVQVVDEGGLPSNTAVATIDVIATNDFPTPADDGLGSTDEDSIVLGGPGGVFFGSLFDDNGSGADDDPEGDDIDVASVSGISASGLPAGAVISGVNDGGTNFNFTLSVAGQVATLFIDKENGNVNVEATTGDFFGLLGDGDTASVSFDYTIADPQGSNGTTATATFDVNGADEAGGPAAPVLDLDANDSSGASTATGFANTFTEAGDGPPPVAVTTPVRIADTDLSITDSDSSQLQGATATLTNGGLGGQLQLFGGPTSLPAGITVSPPSGISSGAGAALTFSGVASIADYETALGLLRFVVAGSDDNPDTTPRTVEIVVTDDSGVDSNTAVATIDVVRTNDFPTPEDDAFTTDEDAIIGAGAGGLLLGSVFDDNGSGADDDPESDDIDVASVSNIQASGLPVGTVVSPVIDGGTTFVFTLALAVGPAARVVVFKEDGNVFVQALTGDFFGLLGDGDTATVSFDYTAADPQGTNVTPATATISVSGAADAGVAPILDLDANDSSGAATSTGFANSFTEAGDGPPPVAVTTPVRVADVDLSITDLDSTQLQGATVTLTNGVFGGQLQLFGGPTNLPSGITVTPVTGISSGLGASLTFSGVASIADYETALGLLRFVIAGSDDNPSIQTRNVEIVVTDDSGVDSNTAVAAIDVVRTNDFPTPEDDAFTTDEDAIIGAGATGLLLGSVFDDNGKGADDDPEGDDIDVASVSNIQTSGLPVGTLVSPVVDGGTTFVFTLSLASGPAARVVVFKEDGNVFVQALTGDFFGLLDNGDTAVVTFDYTIADPSGSSGTTATASITVDGADDSGPSAAPVLDLDANDSSGAATAMGFANSFTEAGDGPPPVAVTTPVRLADTDLSITDLDSAQLQGATVTLTNGVFGGQLQLFGGTGSLPSGITVSPPTGISSGLGAALTFSGVASIADYETALGLLRFVIAGSDDNPSLQTRNIEIVVTDDSGVDSNTAVASIDVVRTNDFPTPEDDAFTTDEDAIIGAGAGGQLLGSVFDDNGSGADDDPESDNIDVASVSNIQTSGLPAATLVSPVVDGGTTFVFTLSLASGPVARVVVFKEDGNVFVQALTGDFFGLLDDGDTATVSFDYTIEDPQGGNGTTATATITVDGAADAGPTAAPVLDLDANDSSGAATATGFANSFTEAGDGPPAVAVTTPVRLADTDLSITDLDSAQLQGATVTLTNGVFGGQLQLFGGTGSLPSGITVSPPTGISSGLGAALTFSGVASIADYQTALGLLRFVIAGSDDNPSIQTRNVEIVVTDDSGVDSNTAVAAIDVVRTNDFPTPEDDAFTTDDGAIVGGSVLGSLFDDNGSGADDDPESDDIDVASVSNVTTSIPLTTISSVTDTGTAFSFTISELGTDVLSVEVDKETGNVSIEDEGGDVDELIETSETITFDYTIEDPSGSNATTATATITIDDAGGGLPLLAAAGEAVGSPEFVPLDPAILDTILDAAIDRWAESGLGDAEVERLSQVDLGVAELPGGRLGNYAESGILLDSDAAGWGWFVDATPLDDSEFVLGGSGGDLLALPGEAAEGVDLLTVLLHELGHALDLPHEDTGLMAESLELGVRRLPASEGEGTIAALAQDDLLQDGQDPLNGLGGSGGPPAPAGAPPVYVPEPASPDETAQEITVVA